MDLKRLFTYKQPKRYFTLEESEMEQGLDPADASLPGQEVNTDNTWVQSDALPDLDAPPADIPDAFPAELTDAADVMKRAFVEELNDDFIAREFTIGGSVDACLCYIDGLCDKTDIQEEILKPAMRFGAGGLSGLSGKPLALFLMRRVICVRNISVAEHVAQAVSAMLGGFVVLLAQNMSCALIVDCLGFEKRGIEKTTLENSVRGPQEAFTESIRTTITQIRRIARCNDFVSTWRQISSDNRLQCAMVYRHGVANKKLIAAVREKLANISTRSAMGDGMIEELISERKYSIVPQILHTQRPDRAASYLMDGHVLLVIDGSPNVLILPATFFSMMSTPESGNERWINFIWVRWLLLIAMYVATVLPSIYVGLLYHHNELMPTEFLLSIISSRSAIAVSAMAEIVFSLFIFQLVSMMGMRLPSASAQVMGVVVALVLGQAAVSANIVSPLMLMVMAITGLCSFSIPQTTLQNLFFILRILFLCATYIAGFLGLSAAMVAAIAYLCSIKCYGVPFFTPFAPKVRSGPDVFTQMPQKNKKRAADYMQT